jgi:hypothetical protein
MLGVMRPVFSTDLTDTGDRVFFLNEGQAQQPSA